MATKTLAVTIDAAGSAVADEVAPVDAASTAVDSTDLEAAIAAAQLIGAGDASAEIDQIETDFTAYKAAVDALVASVAVASGFQITINGTSVANLNRLRAGLNATYARAAGLGFLAEG